MIFRDQGPLQHCQDRYGCGTQKKTIFKDAPSLSGHILWVRCSQGSRGPAYPRPLASRKTLTHRGAHVNICLGPISPQPSVHINPILTMSGCQEAQSTNTSLQNLRVQVCGACEGPLLYPLPSLLGPVGTNHCTGYMRHKSSCVVHPSLGGPRTPAS